ncbi:MAG: type I methionyl aminopeptidase [Patescibacteria group bacterium]
MITIKTKEEIAILREGGQILASVLKQLEKMAEPGVNILDLEKKAEQLIKKAGATPSFLGHKGYPSIICASFNEEVVHCPPDGRILKERDLLSLDCGVIYKKLYTDSARTIPIGTASKEAKKLLKVTKVALEKGIKVTKPGATIGDVSHAIQVYVEGQGLSVVKALVGHGVGYAVHEDPRIPNFGQPGTGEVLKPGMVLAYEPMVNLGDSPVDFHSDGWRVTTRDSSLSAHFEDTIVVTEKGCEILTK